VILLTYHWLKYGLIIILCGCPRGSTYIGSSQGDVSPTDLVSAWKIPAMKAATDSRSRTSASKVQALQLFGLAARCASSLRCRWRRSSCVCRWNAWSTVCEPATPVSVSNEVGIKVPAAALLRDHSFLATTYSTLLPLCGFTEIPHSRRSISGIGTQTLRSGTS
jgi:hypothetical protein